MNKLMPGKVFRNVS